MNSCKIAVVGATGAVGQVFLDIAEQRNFPIDEIRLCASTRSVGKKLRFKSQEVAVELCTPEVLDEVDFAFISASGDVSREMAPLAAKHGTVAIDDSSAFRMDVDVPLVVPEVNADDLSNHKGIVAIPNCSTTPLVMVLNPLRKKSSIKRVVVDTFQSVTGTGIFLLPSIINEFERMYNKYMEDEESKSKIDDLISWCRGSVPQIFSNHQFEDIDDLKMIESYYKANSGMSSDIKCEKIV